MTTQAGPRALGGLVDLLHADLQHRRRGLPARAEADPAQGAAARGRSRARGVRFITDVRPIASVPVRCIQVDAEDHLFLAGRSFIPTHNSTLGLDIARSASVKHHLPAGASSRWR